MMFRKRTQKNKGDEQSRKARGRGPGRPDEKLAKRVLGKDTGRHTFGFMCSPDIHARIKMLAGELQVPIFALAEHLLQLSVGQVARAKENPEERELLCRHLVGVHVEARTIEKFNWYDEELAKSLNDERLQRFAIEDAVRRIVVDFARKGMDPRDMPWYIDFGIRCHAAAINGRPWPQDLTAQARSRSRSPSAGNRPAGDTGDQVREPVDDPGE
jgi:hypothetical protein